MMRRLEFMLQVLAAQGASVADAMTYAALIDRHIFGSGLQEAEMNRRHGLDDPASMAAALAPVHELAAASTRGWPSGWPTRPARPRMSSSGSGSASCSTASPAGCPARPARPGPAWTPGTGPRGRLLRPHQ